jgi:hypothetical protein
VPSSHRRTLGLFDGETDRQSLQDPQARLPCRRGGSNPRCCPECSTIIHASLFAAYLTTASTIRSRRGIRRGKGTDYQTFDENGLETTQFRGKSASNGTGPAPSFLVRPLLGSTTFEKSDQSVSNPTRQIVNPRPSIWLILAL